MDFFTVWCRTADLPEIKHSVVLVLVVNSFLKFSRTFWFFLPFSNSFFLGQTGHTTGREVTRCLVYWKPWGEPSPGLDPGLCGSDSSPPCVHYIVFLSRTLYSQIPVYKWVPRIYCCGETLQWTCKPVRKRGQNNAPPWNKKGYKERLTRLWTSISSR